jgi:hypothetical protein
MPELGMPAGSVDDRVKESLFVVTSLTNRQSDGKAAPGAGALPREQHPADIH